MNNLVISSSPHIKSKQSIEKIMYSVIIALSPALIWGVYVFGIPALKVIVVTTFFCVFFEYLTQKICKITITISDGSAVITGLLLAMNLPSSAPVWLCIVGAFIAIPVAKLSFGGLGNNIFNPALVARVALLISFPVEMTSWPTPFIFDGTTSATPLGVLQTSGVSEAMNIPMLNLFLGRIGGCIGEISVLFLLIGAIYLLYKGYIKFDIPFSYIGTVAVFVFLTNLISPDKTASVSFHLFSGGLILGAFFMATDMVTTPITPRGKIVFGIGCGIITCLIRIWGSYPEGVSFAILLMNSLTPMIDKFINNPIYGKGVIKA